MLWLCRLVHRHDTNARPYTMLGFDAVDTPAGIRNDRRQPAHPEDRS